VSAWSPPPIQEASRRLASRLELTSRTLRRRSSLFSGRTWVCILVFAASFAGTSTAIARLVDIHPAGSDTRPVYRKIDYLKQNLSDYDVVYIGSSRTRRGFKPTVFEAQLAARGIHVRAFNLGLSGLHAMAQDYLARRVLDWNTGNLRLLILAPDDFDVANDQPTTDQEVIWHDFGHTAFALQAVAQAGTGLATRIEWSWNHLRSFALNATASGRLANRADFRSQPKLERVLGPDLDGYLPNPIGSGATDSKERAVANVAAAEAAPPPRPHGFEVEYVRALTALADRDDVPVLFVREPALVADRSRFLRWIAENDPDLPVSDLGDPARHPELFRPQLFFNLGHMNDLGATAYSRSLARELAPLLSSRR
jgi:hypothetical protein